MGKKYAKNPLLFIHQPKEVDLQAPMQHMYVTPKNKKETGNEKVENFDNKGTQEAVKKGGRHPAFDEQNEVKRNNDPKEETKQTKFKDMSIEEKVDYFVNSPSYAPKLRCEIKTEERTFRGVITGSEGNYVYIRVGNRSSSTKVSLDDIKHIRLLGF
ncbi:MULTISPECIES: CotO family spore coat protein [Virgibacillus]|uniref:CotO family spore coat protein n=1 Tax=Virgibacillus TaxID=84406 RepID=UPI000388439D|nr:MULTISPECIES: CotO family spore coat protein [Virgibacillus]EQB35210.1 hypothetical protein M948_19105 [Virgibacillus sp. CM-4]